MALFGKGSRKKKAVEAQAAASKSQPVPGHVACCLVCGDRQQFSRCWVRIGRIVQCPGCGAAFSDPAKIYAQFQPACPHCGEFFEQPGFEYGLCDGCGSKHELVQGSKPGLLPDRKQRAEMAKHGKVWRQE